MIRILSTFSFGKTDKILRLSKTIRMKRLPILLSLCLLFFGCGSVETPVPPAPSASPVPSPTAAPTPDPLARTLRLLLPNAVEAVSLASLGAHPDADGVLRWDEPRLRSYAEALAAAYRTAPADASVSEAASFDEPFVYTAEQPGSRPDADALVRLLLTLAPGDTFEPVEVPMERVLPAVTEESLRASHALLASYTTSFAGKTLSKPNRVHNITLAAERIDGVTVAPDAEFSINRIIGARTKANGYKLAGAIANGVNTTEYGGGVCQVSTTLFNAVLMADLSVTERHHHSWPMAYAPVGRDATIATGLKDFRFRNTSDAPVTIRARVDAEAQTVTVALYGKRAEDFDHIEIVSEQLSRLPSKPAEVRLDESLPPGTKEIYREGRRGRTSVTYLDYYDDAGNLLRRVTAYEDTYPSIGEIAYVSPDLYR